MAAYSWHGERRDFRKEPRPAAPPKPAAPPPESVEGEPEVRAAPMRLVLAEEPAMTSAEVKSRAVDFARWRARHRRLHRP